MEWRRHEADDCCVCLQAVMRCMAARCADRHTASNKNGPVAAQSLHLHQSTHISFVRVLLTWLCPSKSSTTITLSNKHNTSSTSHTPTGRTAYAALAPSALVVSLSTLALSAMPVHRCTAMATQSSR